ncbi:MAG: hypothetical protein QOJ75_37 [Chloroflexota bacterium]|nr:hypothetical protein [Chloroflexota bacterium]
MPDQPLHRRSDDELVAALRSIAPTIAWPVTMPLGGGPDVAGAVRARLEAATSPASAGEAVVRAPAGGPWRRPWSWGPARRALLIALVALIALIALVAIAGAAGLGLPGLRLFLDGGSVSPPPSLEPGRSPTPGRPGASMQLGDPMSPSDLAALDARAGFKVLLPADSAVGSPDAAYVDLAKGGQVSLVWASRPELAATLEPGVGLVMTEFRGSVDPAFFGKVVGADTTVEPVEVSGHPGFWLSGDPHFFFYTGPTGVVVEDSRRWVGDALIWSDGTVTYRLESALGRDTTIRIAASLQ